MAWRVSDFFRWNFFFFKSAWIFAGAFQFSSKTFPCIFVTEKNEDKISKYQNERNEAEQEKTIL